MSAQPEALRLAAELDAEIQRTVQLDMMHHNAAAELRRLHAEVERLSLDSIHTCHAEYQRPVCKLTRERDALRQIVQDFPPIEAELAEVSDRAHRLEAQRDALLEALKLARSIIGHPDDAHTQLIDAAIKAAEGENHAKNL